MGFNFIILPGKILIGKGIMQHKIFMAQGKIFYQVLLVLISLTCFLVGTGWSETYQFVLKWGSSGSVNGKFEDPEGVAVDSSGYVYVVDWGNNRIQKFTSKGIFVLSMGSEGSGDGQFEYPIGIAVDSSGYVYVTDFGNNRIQKFNSITGAFVLSWGSRGSGDGQFIAPVGIAVDSSGYVYVADSYNNRIQKFNSTTGAFVTKWGSPGSGDGQLGDPEGIAVDSSGHVYVADCVNNRIQKFNSTTGAFVTKWGSYGSGNGQFKDIEGIAVDSSGNVYVGDGADYGGSCRIQKFTSTGTFILSWGSNGSGNGQFGDPEGVAIDSSGYVYVADGLYNRIQKFGHPKAMPWLPLLLGN